MWVDLWCVGNNDDNDDDDWGDETQWVFYKIKVAINDLWFEAKIIKNFI